MITARYSFKLAGRSLKPGDEVTDDELSALDPHVRGALIGSGYLDLGLGHSPAAGIVARAAALQEQWGQRKATPATASSEQTG